MKIPTFLFISLLCFCITSCNESSVIEKDQDPADRELGATVKAILEEEIVKEAIWNPENMDGRNWPTIVVENEKELREVIKSLQKNAQKMKNTFQQINQVNQRRYESYTHQLADCQNRQDSLRVAVKFPDIVHLRDTTELIAFEVLSGEDHRLKNN